MATVADKLRKVDRMLEVPRWGWSSSIPPMQIMREAQAEVRAIIAALDRAAGKAA